MVEMLGKVTVKLISLITSGKMSDIEIHHRNVGQCHSSLLPGNCRTSKSVIEIKDEVRVKFTIRKSVFKLITGLLSTAHVTLKADTVAVYLRVQVRLINTGCGYPTENKELFEMVSTSQHNTKRYFYQVSNSYKRILEIVNGFIFYIILIFVKKQE